MGIKACMEHGTLWAGPNFCTKCGETVVDQPQCSVCKAALGIHDVFCGNCGDRVKRETA